MNLRIHRREKVLGDPREEPRFADTSLSYAGSHGKVPSQDIVEQQGKHKKPHMAEMQGQGLRRVI
jgi:hypothetical protein